MVCCCFSSSYFLPQSFVAFAPTKPNFKPNNSQIFNQELHLRSGTYFDTHLRHKSPLYKQNHAIPGAFSFFEDLDQFVRSDGALCFCQCIIVPECISLAHPSFWPTWVSVAPTQTSHVIVAGFGDGLRVSIIGLVK